ncbi:MAG: transposase [Elusimicrobia bacterium]|nr:transposase [Elusimicrobiota bacterium]
MGRPKREHQPGAVHHAYSRGNNGELVFHDDDERTLFLAILADVCTKTRTRVLAYCLMSNHFHLLLEIALASLESVMCRVLGRYARAVNRKNNRTGHVFQARYKAKICRGDRYYQKLLPYLHRNPVKAGMVDKAADWVWSSARQFEGPIRSSLVDVDRALSYMSADPNEARRIYLEGMGESKEDFEPEYDEHYFFCWRSNPQPEPPQPMEALAETIEREFDVDLREHISRPPRLSQGRRIFALRALAEGHRATAIATFLGISRSRVSRALRA